MRSKKGLVGWDMVEMVPRIFMIILVAVGVFGLYVLSYEYYIDVRDAEAIILAREVSDCLVGNGVFVLSDVVGSEYEILEYCGFEGDLERVYVDVRVLDSGGVEFLELKSGDSAALWVRDLFGKTDELSGGNVAGNVDNAIRYNPGYFVMRHDVLYVKNGVRNEGEIEMEVLIRADE